MPAKRGGTPSKTNGKSGAKVAIDSTTKNNGLAKNPPLSAKNSKATPPHITKIPSRETVSMTNTKGVKESTSKKGKGDFLGKGGVLTLGRVTGGRRSSRGKNSGGNTLGPSSSNSTPQGGVSGHSKPMKRVVSKAVSSGRKGASRAVVDNDASIGNEEDSSDSVEVGGIAEMEDSSDEGTHKKRNRIEDGLKDEEGSAGEESEQELQSFMEAFPGMSSDEDGGGEGFRVAGAGNESSSGDSRSESGGEEEEDEEGGLMEVRSCCRGRV